MSPANINDRLVLAPTQRAGPKDRGAGNNADKEPEVVNDACALLVHAGRPRKRGGCEFIDRLDQQRERRNEAVPEAESENRKAA